MTQANVVVAAIFVRICVIVCLYQNAPRPTL